MIRSVVVLGAGNVAFHLTRALLQNTVDVRQVYNRTLESAKEIAEPNGIKFTDKISELQKADLYIISTSDSAIEEISYHIPYSDCLVVHTSGSMPISTLKGNYRKGVFYPMQTFSKERKMDYSKIPFFIEAENTQDESDLMQLALRISDQAFVVDSDKRLQMHISAVFVNNFVNHLYTLAEKLAQENNIPFQVFIPLIEETTQKVLELSPKKAQTGPAARNDEIVVDKHLNALKDQEIKNIYHLLSQSIYKTQND